MCGFYCITFIEYMLARKNLLDYTNLFSLDEYKNNDKIIYKYFRMKKIDKRRKYILDEIKRNDLMNEKSRNTCKYLNMLKTCYFSFINFCICCSCCFCSH